MTVRDGCTYNVHVKEYTCCEHFVRISEPGMNFMNFIKVWKVYVSGVYYSHDFYVTILAILIHNLVHFPVLVSFLLQKLKYGCIFMTFCLYFQRRAVPLRSTYTFMIEHSKHRREEQSCDRMSSFLTSTTCSFTVLGTDIFLRLSVCF